MLKENTNTHKINLIILTLISFDLEINTITKSNNKKKELRKYLKIHDFSEKNLNQFHKLISICRDFEINRKIITEINTYLNYLNLEKSLESTKKSKVIINYKLQQHSKKFQYYSNKLGIQKNYEENFFLMLLGLIVTKRIFTEIQKN